MSSDGDWYKPGPSIREFHASKAPVRVLVGGRGSGKTTAIAVESVAKHGFLIAGARVYILRKTEKSNQDTTGETFDLTFAKMGSAYQDTGYSLFKKMEGGRHYRLPSRKAVELYNEFMKTNPLKADISKWLENVGSKWCSFVQFSGVPTSTSRESRFRGFECSLLILVEADQFDEADVDMAINCLRWKSPDPEVCDERGYIRDMGMILDTNPPGTKHWIALKEDRESKLPPGESMWKFWHLHTEENEQNLPPNYVKILKQTYARQPAMYARMVEGKYADAYDGTPVFWGFTQEHVGKNLPFPRSAHLVRGWDFGTTNAVIFSAYWMEGNVEYWWDLNEIFMEMSDTETQCRRVQEMTEDVFPFWNDRSTCAGVLDYCDPAGDARRDTGRSLSVLQTYGFHPGFKRVGLQVSIAVVNRLLEKRDPDGKPVYRIDEKGCPKLHGALCGGYRYPAVGEPGYGSDEPLKGPACDNFDHVADASRYGKMGALQLIRGEVEPKKPSVGLLKPKPINRKRRWF